MRIAFGKLTHTQCDFFRLLKFYTFSSIFTKQLILMHLHYFVMSDNDSDLRTLACNIFGLENPVVKIFDESHVC